MPYSQSSNLVVARSTRAGGTSLINNMDEMPSLRLTQLLLARLERISADSYWAHRASGIRGSLLWMVEKIENDRPVSGLEMKRLINAGFDVLSQAIRESKRP